MREENLNNGLISISLSVTEEGSSHWDELGFSFGLKTHIYPLTNSVDPDQLASYAALDPHYLTFSRRIHVIAGRELAEIKAKLPHIKTNKKNCAFRVTGLKILGMVGAHIF